MRKNIDAKKMLLALILPICLTGCNVRAAIEPYQHDRENEKLSAIMEQIHQGNISYHTPAPADFHRLLQRDLNAYFREKYKNSNTIYEMLKDEPTQLGVSFPHFYVWAKVSCRGKLVTQGAVSLDAIEQNEFHVTQFFSIHQIRANPEIVKAMPPSTWDKVLNRAKR